MIYQILNKNLNESKIMLFTSFINHFSKESKLVLWVVDPITYKNLPFTQILAWIEFLISYFKFFTL